MFRTFRFGLSALLLLTIFSSNVFAADAVKVVVDHEKVRKQSGETSNDPNRVVKTDVEMVSYDDTESALLAKTIDATIADAMKQNPGATVNVVCATGGRMSSAGCEKQKEDLKAAGTHGDKATFDTIASMEPVLPGVSATGQIPAGSDKATASSSAAAPKKPSDWKIRLSIMRAITAGGAVALTIAIGHPEHWEHMAAASMAAATLVGSATEVAKHAAPVLATTAWSGTMQGIQRPYGNWLRQARWFSTAKPEDARREAFDGIDPKATDVTTRFLKLLREHTVEKPTFGREDLENFITKEGEFNPFEVARDAKARYAIATDGRARRDFNELLAEGGIDWPLVKEHMRAAVQMHDDAKEMKARPTKGKYMSWNSDAGFLKSLGKKAMSSTLYATLMSSAFFLSTLNAHAPFDPEQISRTGQAVVESLYTQTAWETLISEHQERMLERAGKDVQAQARAKRIAGIQRLVLSFVNVATSAMNVLGMHTNVFGTEMKSGLIAAGVVGTAGIITYGYRWLPSSVKKPFDWVYDKTDRFVVKPIMNALSTATCYGMSALGRRSARQ